TLPRSLIFVFTTLPHPPLSLLFPYTTLFRSEVGLVLLGPAVALQLGGLPLDLVHAEGDLLQLLHQRLDLLRADRQLFDESDGLRSEEHTSELQSLTNIVCRLLLEKKNTNTEY